jgi:hypothetical protein
MSTGLKANSDGLTGELQVNGSTVLSAVAAGISIPGTLTVTGAVATGAVTVTGAASASGDVASTAGHHTISADGKGFKGTYATGIVGNAATTTITHPGGCALLLLRESQVTGAWALYGCSSDLAAMVKISSGGAGITWTVTKDSASSVNVYQGASGGGTGNVIIQNLTGSNKGFKVCWLLAV